ncbi:hypothetical protein OG203_35020 [Nocardia sp. NBC_01499]|uniref:hypothetical protein n=1 Tax=Nocardia sp. NBC_01499 TaxID=2903597 RepID=UPI0038678DDE
MLHITSTKHGEATWRIEHKRLWMESFRDCRDDHALDPAYRLRMDGSTVEIPNGPTGLVYFGEDSERPELPFVEERFPAHRDLWEAVENAYWDEVEPLEHSRLEQLNPEALDYTTDRWTVAEIRETAWNIRRSA